MFEDEVEEQLGDSCGINGFQTRSENYPLCKAMVDHDHNRIEAGGRREISDEVDRELFKWEDDGGFDQRQGRDNRMSVSFVLLTDRAAGNETLDKGGETRPPKIMFKDGFGAENTHVTSEGGGMDRMKQSRLGRGGNKHVVAEIEMSIIVGPVRERGPGEQG